MELSIGSVFSGIGGLELGLIWAGHGPVVYQIEKDVYCQQVLERRFPTSKKIWRVETVFRLPDTDIICGGFPCQDVSIAGKGAGLRGARSGLWRQFKRIISLKLPRWVVVENVADGQPWIDAVCSSLAGLGYEAFPFPVAAENCGAAHRRRRVFVVAFRNTDGWRLEGADRILERLRPEYSLSESGRWAWWKAEPGVDRVADGIPYRVDRVRALGNAVVPQASQVIGEIINILERLLTYGR